MIIYFYIQLIVNLIQEIRMEADQTLRTLKSGDAIKSILKEPTIRNVFT